MPPTSLPERPNLQHLKTQAKDLVKAHRGGDRACCPALRSLREFEGKTDADILASGLPLHRAQFAIAMQYGFPSWDALKNHVESLRSSAPGISVHRENGSARIDGIRGWSFAQRSSSVHAAQATIMNALGEDITYDYLVGVSGLAFRMQLHKVFCPSSPHPHCGYECVELSNQALPRYERVSLVKAEDTSGVNAARRAVVESIDRGVPAVSIFEENGVIAGYQKDGAEWICFHPFHEQGQTPFIEPNWPWGVAIYGERKETPPDARHLARSALAQALDMAKTDHVGDYHVGYAAWDYFIKGLKALESADEKTVQGTMQGNAWVYESLVNCRRIAGRFLHEIAPDFPEAAAQLEQAARLYDSMANEILTEGGNTLRIAPYHWSLESGEAWDNAMRRDEVRRLEEALPLERAALKALEQALASSQKPEQETTPAT